MSTLKNIKKIPIKNSSVLEMSKSLFWLGIGCIILIITLLIILFSHKKSNETINALKEANHEILQLRQQERSKDSITIVYHRNRADSFANLKYNSYNETIKNVPFYKENQIKYNSIPNTVKRVSDSNKELLRAAIKPRY